MSRVEERLAELGLALPAPPRPIANFVPWRRHGTLVVLAGQICERDGAATHVGRLGEAFDVEAGVEAARVCALNLLACLKLACDGDLDRVSACLRLGGFVHCVPGWLQVPQVVNGASDLVVALFGEAGRHARTAVGVASLPRGSAVEVEALFVAE